MPLQSIVNTQQVVVNVASFLLEGKDVEKIALQLIDRDHRYGELESAVNRTATYLGILGLQKGDRVLLISENSFFWVAAYLGILRAGLVCVPFPGTASIHELEYVLSTTGARVAFVQAAVAAKRPALFAGMHLVTDRWVSTLPDHSSQVSFPELLRLSFESEATFPETRADDLAALMFTSGSTGRPRGVMVSHGNIVANTESIILYLGLTETDRVMTVLPFHYCFGTSLLHTHLRVGGSLVIDSRFMYPEVVLQRMMDTECTGFAGVPSHYQMLLRTSSLKKKQYAHLRYVQQAGGHLAPAFVHELQEALPTTKVYIQYGQTEATARLSYLPPEYVETKSGSIGRGIPGAKLRVLNDSGLEVKPGEVGEIVAEGSNITQGYWQAPEESASSFRNGRLHTGDLATVDEDGFIFIVDRVRDFLKCGGKRISCRQIEDQLVECEDVLEAAVVGIPDEVLGEAAKAFIVPRAPERDGLKDHLQMICKQELAPQFVPKEIVFLSALPKNSAGKVLKNDLKAL